VAAYRFRVIHPLVASDEFPRLAAQFRGRKTDLTSFIGQRWGVPQRTVYRWLKMWKRGGVAGLTRRKRADAGLPVALNTAALRFLLVAAVPGPNVAEEKSIRQIYREYLREAELRLTCDQFQTEDRLPAVSYETIRVWLGDVPHLARLAAITEGKTPY